MDLSSNDPAEICLVDVAVLRREPENIQQRRLHS
jgi:hypothetical protein